MVGSGGSKRVGSLAAALLAAALACPGPARAAEGEFMRDAMSGIGLIEPERPSITYNDRAPLVMPPRLGNTPRRHSGHKTAKDAGKDNGTDNGKPLDPVVPIALPLPQTRQVDPQWPKDPEIARSERDALEAQKPIVRGAQGRMNDNNMTLSIYEMESGRRAGAGLSGAPAGAPGETRESTWIDSLHLFGNRETPSVSEPARDGLTDPPNGYRKAPLRVDRAQGAPVGGSISGNEEADPRAYLRSQGNR